MKSSVRGGKFEAVLSLIEAARGRAYQAINVELVGLYWKLGEYITRKVEPAQWGDAVADELAAAIARRYAGLRGYTRRNLFRMRQLYEAYRSNEKVSPLVTQLPWTHHLILLSQTKHVEEREFYMLAAIRQRWSGRRYSFVSCSAVPIPYGVWRRSEDVAVRAMLPVRVQRSVASGRVVLC